MMCGADLMGAYLLLTSPATRHIYSYVYIE